MKAIIHSFLALFPLSALIPQGSAPDSLQCEVLTDMGEYELGDTPTLYFCVSNDTDTVVSTRYPLADQIEFFPCDLQLVELNGSRLPFKRTPLNEPVPRVRTTLRPGETYTVGVSIDRVVEWPTAVGHYEVQATDFFPQHSPAESTGFDVVDRIGTRRQTELSALSKALQGNSWRGVRLVSSDRTELAQIARSPVEPVGLRIRALVSIVERFPSTCRELQLSLVGDRNPIVALEALGSIRAPPDLALAEALLAAVAHRDVAVRRLAAEKLAGSVLDGPMRARLTEHHRQAEDKLLREHLARALGLAEVPR